MSDVDDSQTQEYELQTVTQDGVLGGALFGPELLNAEDAERLLARVPGRVVVWLGERDAGKTSISVELYERQRHPGAQTRFAGSWTLLALEQLAHQRRATGAPPPTAPRDLDPEDRELLHVALSDGGEPVHLLIADLPGEVFRRLADNQLAVGDIPWLGRADRLVILVDGARLCDAGARSSTVTRVRQLAERLRSSRLPQTGTGLALLVTKWDLVDADPAAVTYWPERERELLAELRTLDPDAVALHVAANNGHAGDDIAPLRSWLLGLSPAPEAPAASEPAVVDAQALGWTVPLSETAVARPAETPLIVPPEPMGEARPVEPTGEARPVEPTGEARPVEPTGEARPVEPAGGAKPADPAPLSDFDWGVPADTAKSDQTGSPAAAGNFSWPEEPRRWWSLPWRRRR